MEKHLNNIRTTRKNFLSLIESLRLDELNKIPTHFSNNIIWNFGHVLITQQLLCYKLSDTPMRLDKEVFMKYAKGSRPEQPVDEAELQLLKKAAIDTTEQLAQDLKEGIFQTYRPYTTSFGVELQSIEDAVRFDAVHEGLHLGYSMALRRLIKGT